MAGLPRLEPLHVSLGQSAPLDRTPWGTTLALMTMVEGVIAAPAFGVRLPATLPLAATGLVSAVIGNALPKPQPGFFVGIRTPWTLIDPQNWIATHRFAAWTWVAAGAASIAAAALAFAPARPALIGAAVALRLAPPPYSWWLWRRARRG